jgi:transposase
MFFASVNTTVFIGWIEQDLLPKLPTNSVLIMDNATFHKGCEMLKIIEKAGHEILYLPPYSPDLNPIEKNGPKQKTFGKELVAILMNYLSKINCYEIIGA